MEEEIKQDEDFSTEKSKITKALEIKEILVQGIDINKNSWEKPAIFKVIESFNAIDERELHKSFNMGIGLVMVVEKDKAEEVVNFINNREEEIHVDAKYTELMKDRAYIIGEVVDTHEGVNLC